MLKRITLLGLLALVVSVFSVQAGFYKQNGKDVPTDQIDRKTVTGCLTDAQTKKYLRNYFSIVLDKKSGEYGYKTDSNGDYVQPKGIAAGEVIIVEVNDLWKGVKLTAQSDIGANTVSSLFDQIKFGVKKITKVTNSVKIPSGTIYGVNLTTNRYFFAKRRPDFKYKQGYSFDYLAMRWYDEWSTVKSTDKGWDGLTSSYAALQNGDPQIAPHNCDTSLELNHFTVLNKDTVGTTEAITTFLYIPDGVDGMTDLPAENSPYQFFYRGFLDGTLSPVGGANPTAYNADLHWTTSFDKCNAAFPNTQYYTADGKTGIREFYDVYRVNEDGSVSPVKTDFTSVEQTLTDPNLPVREVGYDVTYYVVSRVWELQDGKKVRQVGNVTTNTVTLHVPGSEAFELYIEGGGIVGYIPREGFNSSVNKFDNTIKGRTNIKTPKLVAGDVLKLMRSIEGVSGKLDIIQTLKVLEVKADGKVVYTLTPDDPNGKTYTAADNDKAVEAAAGYVDSFEAPAGSARDAQYMLSLVRGPGEEYQSNIVNIPSFKTVVTVAGCHRSGVPDDATCVPTELIVNEISFAPLVSGEISSYFILRNHVPVVRLSQPTDATGTQYAVTYKGADGKFNVDGGFVQLKEGNLVFADTIQTAVPVNNGEIQNPKTAIPSQDYIYTVVIRHVNRNTYGNNDDIAQFKGEKAELVVNLDCTAEYGRSVWEGRFRTVLNWKKIKSQIDVLQPERYEIYYTEVGTPGFQKLTQIMEYDEIRKNVNGVSKLAGYTPRAVDVPLLDGDAVTFTDDYVWDGNKNLKGMDTHPDFVKQPRSYYVKAIFPVKTGAELISNVDEKNSNIGIAYGSGIQTMVEEISAEETEVLVYPNPATEYAVVRNAGGIGSVTVFNLTGAAVINIAGGGEPEIILETANLAAGTYFVSVNGAKPEKLIVK